MRICAPLSAWATLWTTADGYGPSELESDRRNTEPTDRRNRIEIEWLRQSEMFLDGAAESIQLVHYDPGISHMRRRLSLRPPAAHVLAHPLRTWRCLQRSVAADLLRPYP